MTCMWTFAASRYNHADVCGPWSIPLEAFCGVRMRQTWQIRNDSYSNTYVCVFIGQQINPHYFQFNNKEITKKDMLMFGWIFATDYCSLSTVLEFLASNTCLSSLTPHSQSKRKEGCSCIPAHRERIESRILSGVYRYVFMCWRKEEDEDCQLQTGQEVS